MQIIRPIFSTAGTNLNSETQVFKNVYSIIQFLVLSLHSTWVAETNYIHTKLLTVSLRFGFLPFPRT